MSTFDSNFPAKPDPKMADRAFAFDSETGKNIGITNQALYDLFKGELDPTLPKIGDFLPAFDLNNPRVMTSTAPDNKIVKSNVLDPLTGDHVTFREYEGTAPILDGVVFINHGGKTFKRTSKEYYIESFGKIGVGNDSAILQKALDGVAQTDSKKLIIDGYDLILTTEVVSADNEITIEFRNGGQLSQPIPINNASGDENLRRLSVTGGDWTLINFKIDGKYNNDGLDAVLPGAKNSIARFSGNNVHFKGVTILENSGAYNVDIRGDLNVIDHIKIKNNAYSGIRYFASGTRNKSFKIGVFEGENNFGPKGRKTGLTVNGEVVVETIEIGSYIGLNASPFFEATVEVIGSQWYKNVKIGFLRNEYTSDTLFPDGSTAVSNLGKMENIETLTIGKIEGINLSPEGRGTGMWFTQTTNTYIGEIHTNAGDWRFGRNTKIGLFHYYFGNNASNTYCLTKVSSLGASKIVIDDIIVDIPEGQTTYAGVFETNPDSVHEWGTYKAIRGGDIGITRATSYLVRDQIKLDDYRPNLIDLSTANSSMRQSISYPVRKMYVVSPTSITRDVITGEVFVFTSQTNFTHWVVREGGTCSWSGSTFAGTAKFTKYFINQNYAGTPLDTFTALLTSDDAGMVIKINNVLNVWDGGAWRILNFRISVPRTTSNYLLVTADAGFYIRLTGSAGNITVPSGAFKEEDEVIGEIEGGAKTFVASTGVTLRHKAGFQPIVPTNGQFKLKFKSATNVLLTGDLLPVV